MAGIGGWAGTGKRVDHSVLRRLVDAAVEPTSWHEADVALAWSDRRPPSAGAPSAGGGLAQADDLVVVFEGTLTDRATLRTFLERRGADATSGHDAELVLRAWRELGSAALDRLEGTFAMAVWSRSTRELTLARDRLGGGSLAWARDGRGVAFATDPARLADVSGAPRNPARIFEVLLQGHVSPPHTHFRDVRTVEPGYLVRFGVAGSPRVTRYFAPSFIPRTEAPGELAARLGHVAQAHLESGAGGPILLDGGAGGAALAHVTRGAVDTISVRMRGDDDLGEPQARALGTRHQAVELVPESLVMADIVAAHGGPFATALPLLGQALPAIPHLWSGLGAETLAGLPARVAHVLRGGSLAPWAGRALRRGSELVADVTLSPLRSWLESMAALGEASESPLGQRLLAAGGVFPPQVLASIVRPRWHAALFDLGRWSERVIGEATATTPLGRALSHRLRSHLAEERVPGLDRALRRVGTELHLPYFDRRWIELATGITPGDRPRALEALIPPGVPRDSDIEERLLARWMGGPLERMWRDVVFADASPLSEVIDLSRVRALLLAEISWNPGRWRQALALWTTALWLS